MKRVHRLISLLLIALMIMPVPLAVEAAGTASFAVDEIVSESAVITAPVDLSDVSEDTAATDELLVLVERGTTKKETSNIANEAGASLENISELNDGSRLARVSLDDPEDMQKVADNLASEDCVVIVQPNYIYKAYEDDAVTDVTDEEGEGQEPTADGEETVDAAENDDTGDLTETITEQEKEAEVPAEAVSAADEDGGYDIEKAANDNEKAWDYNEKQQYLTSGIAGGIDAVGAWDLLSENENKIRVAVIDSGAELEHPDLEDSIIKDLCVTYNNGKKGEFTDWDGSNDSDGHGTHVCGIIAAKVGDSKGVSGIANNRAELMVIDAELPKGNLTTQDIVLSINYAADNGARLINLSVGGLYKDFLMEKAVCDAYDKGALCICASGNEGSSLPQTPGDTSRALSVMSHKDDGYKLDGSNYGLEKDVSAPGERIYSTYIGNTPWKEKSGTSMAAPMVTGTAVLLLSENESLFPRQLKNLIYTSSYTSSGSNYFDGSVDAFGFGRINAKTAIENAKSAATEPKEIVLNRTQISMFTGETVDLEYAVYPGTASIYADDVTFSSSNEEIASVDENGRIGAVAPGNATITVSYDEDVKSECSISVGAVEYNKAVLPFSAEDTLSPSDPKVIVTTGSRTWESYTDGYELGLIRGQTIGIAIEPSTDDKSTIIPGARIIDPAGEVKLLRRGRSKRTLSVSFEADKKGTYILQVLGETMGGAAEEKPYKLKVEDISKASLSGVADKTYTGSDVRHTLTVRYGSAVLAAGRDYKETYINNKNTGTATVMVTGSGDYGFSLTRTFNILPKGTKISKLSRARKAAVIRWKKQAAKMSSSRITGYQIQAATDAGFTKNIKTVTVKGYKKTSKRIKGLKAKKKYYVRIRTYKTVNGTKYYSAWSKARTVKTR